MSPQCCHNDNTDSDSDSVSSSISNGNHDHNNDNDNYNGGKNNDSNNDPALQATARGVEFFFFLLSGHHAPSLETRDGEGYFLY